MLTLGLGVPLALGHNGVGLLLGIRQELLLLFFGLLSLIVFAVALILFIPVFIEYGRTGLVRRLPTLVTAGFMGMAALLLLVCGLILDTQGKTSRQQYELQMNAMQMLYDLGRQERQGEAEGKKAS